MDAVIEVTEIKIDSSDQKIGIKKRLKIKNEDNKIRKIKQKISSILEVSSFHGLPNIVRAI